MNPARQPSARSSIESDLPDCIQGSGQGQGLLASAASWEGGLPARAGPKAAPSPRGQDARAPGRRPTAPGRAAAPTSDPRSGPVPSGHGDPPASQRRPKRPEVVVVLGKRGRYRTPRPQAAPARARPRAQRRRFTTGASRSSRNVSPGWTGSRVMTFLQPSARSRPTVSRVPVASA